MLLTTFFRGVAAAYLVGGTMAYREGMAMSSSADLTILRSRAIGSPKGHQAMQDQLAQKQFSQSELGEMLTKGEELVKSKVVELNGDSRKLQEQKQEVWKDEVHLGRVRNTTHDAENQLAKNQEKLSHVKNIKEQGRLEAIVEDGLHKLSQHKVELATAQTELDRKKNVEQGIREELANDKEDLRQGIAQTKFVHDMQESVELANHNDPYGLNQSSTSHNETTAEGEEEAASIKSMSRCHRTSGSRGYMILLHLQTPGTLYYISTPWRIMYLSQLARLLKERKFVKAPRDGKNHCGFKKVIKVSGGGVTRGVLEISGSSTDPNIFILQQHRLAVIQEILADEYPSVEVLLILCCTIGSVFVLGSCFICGRMTALSQQRKIKRRQDRARKDYGGDCEELVEYPKQVDAQNRAI